MSYNSTLNFCTMGCRTLFMCGCVKITQHVYLTSEHKGKDKEATTVCFPCFLKGMAVREKRIRV